MEAQFKSPERVPLAADEPKTLVQVFEQAVQKHNRPDALNYKSGSNWTAISSAEMLQRIRNIAAGLYSLGIKRGERVALLSESRPEWTLSDAGCLFAGAIDVPIYPTLTPAQVRYILKDSGARVLIVANEEKFREVREVLSECPALEHIVFIEPASSQDVQGLSLAELEQRGAELAKQQPELFGSLGREISPDDLATIIYTSGTTGE